MVQPRKEQIKSVNTKFTFGTITGFPGYSDIIIPIGIYSITQTPGGAEENVQATTLGTVISPFPILAGDAIRIAIDGAPSVLITFVGTDVTVSRIAARINTTLGLNIAFNQDGYLLLKTVTTGAGSSIVLSDISPGVLSKLGLVAGTYTGLKGPVRGVLTRTPDGLGGLVRLATQDGRHLVTDTTDFRMVNGDTTFEVTWAASVLGGTPIHGRLTNDGSSYHLKSYAKLPAKASVITYNSTFSLLDGSDQLNLTVDEHSFSVSFPSFPYTRDQLVDLINTRYAATIGFPIFTDGRAFIIGTISSPFYLTSGESFSISIDGGSQNTVVFTGSEVTTDDVAAVINATVGSTVATVVNNGYARILRIASLTTNGRLSSIELNDRSFSKGVLSKLGLRSGLYRGPFIAEPYGPDEIKITSKYRGSTTHLQIAGNPATLTRIGLTAGSYDSSDTSKEELVQFPYQKTLNVSGYNVDMIFPEVMEFGDITPPGDSEVQDFLDKSAGSNQAISSINPKFSNTTYGINYISTCRGLSDVGKPVVVGPDGSISVGYLQSAIDQSNVFFKQFLRCFPNGTVFSIVGNRFEGAGYGGNSLPTSEFMEFYADPTNSSPNYGEIDFFVGTATYNYSNLVAYVARDSGSGATFGPNTPGYVAITNGGALVSWNSTSGPLSAFDGLKLASGQTINAGGTGLGYIPLTAASNNNDGVPRLADASVRNVTQAGPYSIMRALNARHEVTLGDGVSTFGDFNGADAFHQVQAYLFAVGATVATIKVKRGYYVTTYTVDFSFLTDLVIDGYYEHPNGSPVLISHQWAYECLTLPANGYTKINGIAITNDYGAGLNLIRVDGGIVELNGCWINAGGVFATNIIEFHAYRTQFIGRSMPVVVPSPWLQAIEFDIWNSDTHSQYTKIIEFDECFISSPVGGAAIAVYDYSTLGLATVEIIKVSDCAFDLSNIAVSGTALQSQGGIISFNPGGDAYSGLGVEIRDVQIRDCSANTSLGGYGTGFPMVFNVVPNGWLGAASYSQGHSYPAIKIDNFSIKHLYVGYWNSVTTASVGPAIAIGGIGINSDYGGKLSLEDVVIDPFYSTFGQSTDNMNAWFTEYAGDNYGSAGDSKGGLICLAAKHIEVKDITFLNSTARTTYNDIFLCSYGKLDVDGIEIAVVNGGYGSTPSSRICIRENNYQVSTFNMKGIRFYNFSAPDTWAFLSIILVETRNGLRNTARISDSYISLYCTSGGSNVNGIKINKYASRYNGPDQSNGGIIIENCYIGSQRSGSAANVGLVRGIDAYGDNIKIKNVIVDSCVYQGIAVESTLHGSVTVEDCDITLCGSLENCCGLQLFSRRAPTSHNVFNVMNNTVSSNNSDPSNVQINIRDIDGWGAKTTAQVYGNSTVFDDDYWGFINVTLNVDTQIPAGFQYPGTCRVQGIETGFSGNTGAFAGNGGNGILYLPDFWPFVSLSCIHNFAMLVSSTTAWD
jgi:hypothetical protein